MQDSHTYELKSIMKLAVSHPDVFKDEVKNVKTVKRNLFIIVVELTWETCFDLV